ncbi:Protein kinase domain [Trypanosoma vivax]|uniref:non-specific serine/threonine protein kinase n=1 Tax=Trypanosoma vivax (strain Y486) TaxID=1055687 RepID=G0UB80_TRYVY|nr:Protein kinase domain [Trypanosoma vivax]CCC53067.1 putative protein kinase [Trypanosoma vivax Y486]
MHAVSLRDGDDNKGFAFEVSKVKLGSGSSGVVLLGRRFQTHELVAVKRLYVRRSIDHSERTQRGSYSHPCLGSGRVTQDNTVMATAQMARSVNGAVENGEVENSSFHSRGSRLECKEWDWDARNVQGNDSDGAAPSFQSLSFVTTPSFMPTAAAGTMRGACEAEILRYLGPHHHIVKFFGDYTGSSGVSFFAMELMDSDLGKEIRAANMSFTDEEVARPLLYSVALAIDHLHKHDVAHRDIKPSNILLKYVNKDSLNDPDKENMAASFNASAEESDWAGVDGDVDGGCYVRRRAGLTFKRPGKCMLGGRGDDVSSQGPFRVRAALGDFSVAHSVKQAETVSGGCGTLLYKSPEQLMGRMQDCLPCDMWALGCTMYELITGFPAFPGTSELQVLNGILARLGSDIANYPSKTHEATLLCDIPPTSAEFIDLLGGLLKLDPAERLRAEEVVEHPFFAALRNGRGGGTDDQEVTFHTRMQCVRQLDATRSTFRAIATPSKRTSVRRSKGTDAPVEPERTEICSSRSGKRRGVGSAYSARSSTSFFYRSTCSQRGLGESINNSFHCVNWGNYMVAGGLSFSPGTARSSKGKTREKENEKRSVFPSPAHDDVFSSARKPNQPWANDHSASFSSLPLPRAPLCYSKGSLHSVAQRDACTNILLNAHRGSEENGLCACKPIGEEKVAMPGGDDDLIKVSRALF